MSEQLPSDPSDTPKTDAVAFWITNDRVRREAVFADVAREQERALNEALKIIRDYFYVETRKQGQKMDARANAFLIKMGAS